MTIPTPTLDKIKECQPLSETIGNFLEWLGNNQYSISKKIHYHYKEENISCTGENCLANGHWEWMPWPLSINDLLHQYFEIDPDEEEKEKRVLLDYIREQNKGRRNE